MATTLIPSRAHTAARPTCRTSSRFGHAALGERGHDILAVVEQDALRVLPDEELFRWQPSAAAHRDRESQGVRPLLRRAEELGRAAAPVLFTSSRSFARSRRNPGGLIDTLDAWLCTAKSDQPLLEDWLQCA